MSASEYSKRFGSSSRSESTNRLPVLLYKQTNIHTNRHTDTHTSGRTDGKTETQMDGRTDGRFWCHFSVAAETTVGVDFAKQLACECGSTRPRPLAGCGASVRHPWSLDTTVWEIRQPNTRKNKQFPNARAKTRDNAKWLPSAQKMRSAPTCNH